MNVASLLLLALGLAMDATAAAAAQGLSSKTFKWRTAALCALLFGGFQAIMPLIGYGAGYLLGPVVERWEHWIAFVLLTGLGAKMIYESNEEEKATDEDPSVWQLLIIAVATSIDALVVGVTLPLIKAPLLLSIATIGLVTAALSAFGVWAGRMIGDALGGKLDVFGGLVLIGLGLRFLIASW